MVVALISKAVTKVFGSRNERLLKSYHRRVEQINALEPEIAKLTDVELRARSQRMQQRLAQGEKMSALLPEALAIARQAMDRAVGIRNIFNPDCKFDPQTLPADIQPLYAQVQAKSAAIQPTLVPGGGEKPIPAWMQVEIPVAIYDAVRQLHPQSRPPFRARPFDVQLIGGMVLYEGRIAEMKTGEGKTIVAPLACYLACLEGLHCHVVTVNDYLVQRDRDWVFPFYYHLGLSVGAIHPYHMQPPEAKQQAYLCNVVYGTNAEFGFDYLRDNMKLTVAEQVQKQRQFCIVDEVDSILIDEARTPLIISGPAREESPRYDLADKLAQHLMQKQREWDQADEKVMQAKMRIKALEGEVRTTSDKAKIPAFKEETRRLQEQLPALEAHRDEYTQYYEVEREKKAAHLTHEGVAEAQKVANVGSFYVGNNMDLPHLLENALRAHVIYQRDKDYVVQNGEVVIVDEFTGRLMIGRQWSDGLHQAVEAKEKVKIKEETQTLATITIQNFFKLYKRLAGMTGTALTEVTEFDQIYRLDVVVIPTNVPCVRQDLEDIIYVSQKDKWDAIIDEIKRMHDVGRPVLVGTTSVENSEMLAQLLTRKHGIRHEVLNAKQHEREALIVLHAGELGAVMIATNMAGRGTDIKLGTIDRAMLVRHWQQRNLLPKEAKPEMSDEEILRLSYRHQGRMYLGWKPAEMEAKSDEEIQLALCREWVANCTLTDPDKARKSDLVACLKVLDATPNFILHRLKIYQHIEEMGGLHIVGTERHEARRIDNQLRGRAGRQGDQGSSRFFISLDDDLMKLFANKAVLTALSKLGMKEGVAIEHRWITKSVERAQRKVEERNFEIRKSLLEYDEVMEYQRTYFYGIRQQVLEGRDIEQLVFAYIADSVDDAVQAFLDRDYVPSQISEWCRQELDVLIESHKLRESDYKTLERVVFEAARDEIRQTVELTTGEYMSHDVPPEEWDLRGLSSWAMSRFNVDLKQTQLRQMNPEDVKAKLTEAALVQLEKKDLAGLAKFLVPHFAYQELANWAAAKFNVQLNVEEMAQKLKEEVPPYILAKARAAYARREIDYPVDFALDMAFSFAQQDAQYAATQLSAWVNHRYGLNWSPEEISKTTGQELRQKFLALQEEWLTADRLRQEIAPKVAEFGANLDALAAWARQRYAQPVEVQELADAAQRVAVLERKGREMLRYELTQLERYVLLQILDTTWKEHLYVMDQLKDSVGLRGYAEKDPRIEYKREGANMFGEMQALVRNHVTDLIFRARLSADAQARNVYGAQRAEHAEAGSIFEHLHGGGDAQPSADQEAAAHAGSAAEPLSRKQRRAAAATQEAAEDDAKKPQFKERKKKRK